MDFKHYCRFPFLNLSFMQKYFFKCQKMKLVSLNCYSYGNSNRRAQNFKTPVFIRLYLDLKVIKRRGKL